MTAKRQDGWQRLFVILTVLPCCMSLQVSFSQSEYEVAQGGDISLTCSFTPARTPVENIVISWGAFPDDPNEPLKSVATYFINKPVDIGPAYEGRANLQVDLNSYESTLHLTKLTIQDSRSYQCKILIPNDDEGNTAAVTSVLVLVPPSPPVCQVQGTAEYFHNISLTCRSEQGSPKPVAEWMSYSVENLPRAFPPKTTQKDGALSLFNISREMSGFYICKSTNRIGSAECNLTLSVLPPSMNVGSTAAIVGGVFGGLAVLGIIIFCCIRRRNKNKNKNIEGSPEDVYYDRDGPEDGEQYRDDESGSKTHQLKYEDKDVAPQNNYSVGVGGPFDDDQQSHKSGRSGKERHDGKGSDVDSQRYQDSQYDRYRGSSERLDEKRNQYGGSRDRLDDSRNHYGGSRDRLDDNRDRYGGSRDRLDDKRDRYGGSRDRLDDKRDRYGGSRDRLDDNRDRYGGSRDRLDDKRDRYGGSRDRLDDNRGRYGGSRDRLDDHRDHHSGSDRYHGSREHLSYADDD